MTTEVPRELQSILTELHELIILQQKCFTVKRICLLVAMATFVLVVGVVDVI
jgi:hypothetical protein